MNLKPLAHKLLGGEPTYFSPLQRTTHNYVIGQPGTGKSRALESWALQDILAGQGVAVVDPHGDLYQGVKTSLAMQPELDERVVLLDPCDKKWVISFNPLEALKDVAHERLALLLTDVVTKIWKLDSTNAPRMVWLMTNTFLALSDLGLTLLELPRFLLDTDYRNTLLPCLKNEMALAFFIREFPTSPPAIQQWVAPILTRIGRLIFDPDIRPILAGRTTINFREILDKRLVLLVHLPKGIIGEGPSALLGAFIVAHLQKAALARTESSKRIPFFLYLDEFQNYTTDNIKDILSESRKYGLSLILAHQYLDQLSSDFQSAVLNTTGTITSFRVGYHDAYQLAKEIFPSSDFLKATQRDMQLQRFGRWPFPTIKEQHVPLGWEGLAQRLASLPSRQFWSRQRMHRIPNKFRTLDMPEWELTPELQMSLRELRDISGQRYGQLKKKVQDELANRSATMPMGAAFTPDDSIPMWGQ